MTYKEICEIIADAMASSQGPHPIWRDIERRTVTLTDEFREALCTIMADIWCAGVPVGSYVCQVQTRDGICVDYCLEGEINRLRNEGINTIGCCCGHARLRPYIQVSPDSCNMMRERGYEQLPLDAHGHGAWCYRPKTILPQSIQGGGDGKSAQPGATP